MLNRKTVLKATTASHRSVIRDFRALASNLLESEAVVNEDEMDLRKPSVLEKLNNQVMILRIEIAFTESELNNLNRLVVSNNAKAVSPGAMFIADDEVFSFLPLLCASKPMAKWWLTYLSRALVTKSYG